MKHGPGNLDQLERLPPGARLRLFHLEDGERRATSGVLLGVSGGKLHLAPDAGGRIEVPLAAVTCFYAPGS